MTSRICKVCSREFPLAEFPLIDTGISSSCRECLDKTHPLRKCVKCGLESRHKSRFNEGSPICKHCENYKVCPTCNKTKRKESFVNSSPECARCRNAKVKKVCTQCGRKFYHSKYDPICAQCHNNNSKRTVRGKSSAGLFLKYGGVEPRTLETKVLRRIQSYYPMDYQETMIRPILRLRAIRDGRFHRDIYVAVDSPIEPDTI